MIAVFKILTSKENASDEAFSLLVLYQLGSWTGVRTAPTTIVTSALIIPAGELDGRQDHSAEGVVRDAIIPAGELDGRQD